MAELCRKYGVSDARMHKPSSLRSHGSRRFVLQLGYDDTPYFSRKAST